MQGLSYHVDLAFCIDATGSMAPIIDQAKERALRFHDDVTKELDRLGKSISKLRVRVVCFRDFYCDGNAAISSSAFFELPTESDRFRAFLNGIEANGGGDEPESGLEALAAAFRSDWTRDGDRQRHVIVIWTDASAHKLPGDGGPGAAGLPPAYPKGLPSTLDQLTDLWHSQELNSASSRLLVFAPDAYPWNTLAEHWENTLHHASRAGQGLKDVDYNVMLDMIARSVG